MRAVGRTRFYNTGTLLLKRTIHRAHNSLESHGRHVFGVHNPYPTYNSEPVAFLKWLLSAEDNLKDGTGAIGYRGLSGFDCRAIVIRSEVAMS